MKKISNFEGDNDHVDEIDELETSNEEAQNDQEDDD
jgi:hypothetical protein